MSKIQNHCAEHDAGEPPGTAVESNDFGCLGSGTLLSSYAEGRKGRLCAKPLGGLQLRGQAKGHKLDEPTGSKKDESEFHQNRLGKQI